MHHCGVKTSLLDPSMTDHHRHHHHQQQQPLCPKPRRIGCAAPELLVPLRCTHHSQPAVDGRNGILNLIVDKGLGSPEPTCTGCLPPGYAGSPPSRTDNPLVHDVQFIRQMELLSPFTRTKLSDKFGCPVRSSFVHPDILSLSLSKHRQVENTSHPQAGFLAPEASSRGCSCFPFLQCR